MSADNQQPPVIHHDAMTFTEHLAELRRRIIFCVVTVVVLSMVTFMYADPIIHVLQVLVPPKTVFVQLSPGEVFLASFKLSVFAGIGLSLPVILYHIFRFVSPGLEPKEKRYILPMLVLGFILFVVGVLVGYYGILPFMLDFLLGYGQSVAQNQLSIASFLNFCVGFLFASGLLFQIPLFLLLISFTGLINSTKLLKQWKWAIVMSFFLAAVATPSVDPFSQTVMAVCLVALYGFSILLMKVFGH